MTKKNPKNDPLDLFPIPNDAIYINSKKNLNPRDKIISALKKYLKDKNLDLPLGPKLDLNNPLRSSSAVDQISEDIEEVDCK